MLWELMMVLAILFAFLYCAVMFLSVFVQFESLSYAAKTVARQIEITGSCDSETVMDNITALTENTNLIMGRESDGLIYEITDVSDPPAGTDPALSNNLYPYGAQRLQLRQTFKITLYATYELELIGPIDGSLIGAWTVTIPLAYSVTGMSEVFWRN